MADAILYDYGAPPPPTACASRSTSRASSMSSALDQPRPRASKRAADYRALNPQGLVPMLEIDGHRLTQSLSIMVYLDQTRPEPLLMPRDPADGAHVRAMALAIACDIHPLNNLRVLKYLKRRMRSGAGRPERRWYGHWMREGFAALEAMAAPRAGGFLFGDTPTIADVCLVPQMYNARRVRRAARRLSDAGPRRRQCAGARRLRRRPPRQSGGSRMNRVEA